MKALHGLLIALLLVTVFVASSAASPVASSVALPVDQDGSAADLQRRADTAKGAECARLSMQAARQALEEANRYFEAGNVKAAHSAIDVSLHYVRRSVECSLQAHKNEKNAEIELRKLIRRMRDILQTLDSEDRQHLARSVTELEKQRDKLLHAIFGTAAGGAPEKKP